MPGRRIGVAEAGRPHVRHSVLTAACALLGLLSVAPLLAWLFRLGSFSSWFWAVSAPALLLLIVIGLFAARKGGRLRAALITGCVGGLAGTIGYDLFRVPFEAFGFRLLAPIDSYGLLLLNAESSTPWTGFAGWSYHFANGIGFGIAYAVIALGRRWWWGVAWGVALETATIVTPFVETYGLKNRWGLIALAYAAHFFYGAPLGKIVEHAEEWTKQLSTFTPRILTWTLVILVSILLLWHRPFSMPAEVREGEDAAPGPSAVLIDGRLHPEWLRVAPGGCVAIRNDDRTRQTLARGPALEPGELSKVCFRQIGIERVRLAGEVPYSGGFVIVDPQAER